MMSRIEKNLIAVSFVIAMLLVEVIQWRHLTWEQFNLPWHPESNLTAVAFMTPFALMALATCMIYMVGMFIALLKGMKAELVALVQAPAQRKIKLATSFGIMSWFIKLAFAAGGKGQMAVGEAWATSLIMVGSMWLIIFTAASAYRAWHQNEQKAN